MMCFRKKHLVDVVYEGELSYFDGKNREKFLWWAVDGAKGEITKFSNNRKNTKKGKSISIVNADIVCPFTELQCSAPDHTRTRNVVEEEGENRASNHKNRSFQLKTSCHQVELIAATVEERNKWVDALYRCSKGFASGVPRKIAARGILHGKYVFVRELGRGSSASVGLYLYQGKPYAIKKFLNLSSAKQKLLGSKNGSGGNHDSHREQNSSPSSKPMSSRIPVEIRREIAILKRVSQLPNVIPMYEVIDDKENNELYIVMEYLGGGPAAQWNEKERRYTIPGRTTCLSEATARAYIRDVALALSVLHSNKLCHRDIKPENLLITEDRKSCKIGDFGVAHCFEDSGERSTSPQQQQQQQPQQRNIISKSSSTSRGDSICTVDILLDETEEGGEDGTLKNTKGTYQFMAPETLTGQDFDGYKADIWALGVTLYAFVFAELPFYSSNILELFDLIAELDVCFPQRCSSVGSPMLRDLILKMLEKDPTKRITVHELINHPWVLASDNTLPKYKKQLVAHMSKSKNQSNVLNVSIEEVNNAICSIDGKIAVIRQVGELNNEQHLKDTLRGMHSTAAQNQVLDDQCALERSAKAYVPHPASTELIVMPHCIETVVVLLAEQQHFAWCHAKIMDGWRYAVKRDDTNKVHPLLLPFAKLGANDRAMNVATVTQMIKTVIALGYKITTTSTTKTATKSTQPTRNNSKKHTKTKAIVPFDLGSVSLPAALVILSELLAENAHEVWASQRVKQGWTYGAKWDITSKKHPSLVPFMYVPECDRSADLEGAITMLKSLVFLGFQVHHEQRKYDERRGKAAVFK